MKEYYWLYIKLAFIGVIISFVLIMAQNMGYAIIDFYFMISIYFAILGLYGINVYWKKAALDMFFIGSIFFIASALLIFKDQIGFMPYELIFFTVFFIFGVVILIRLISNHLWSK